MGSDRCSPRSQSALLDDKARNLIDTVPALQVRKTKRSLSAHSQRIRLHYFEVCTYERSQIDLVDNEKIGARNAGPALRGIFSPAATSIT